MEYGEKHYSHPNLTRVVADLADLDDLFYRGIQMVTAFEIVEHTDKAPAFLERVAADFLVCSVPNENTIPFAEATHREHYRHYRPVELHEELQAAGWQVQYMGSQPGKRKAKAKIKPELTGRTLIAYAHRSL